MTTSYSPWSSTSYHSWENLSSIPNRDFDAYGITYVYLILASEEWTTELRFIVTCVLYQPKSGSYFECIFRGNDSSQADYRVRRAYSIYEYMKSQSNRDLKIIFRFDNHPGRIMIQKSPETVCLYVIVKYR